ITLKDDQRGDPPVTAEILDALGIMSMARVEEAKALVKKAAEVLRRDLGEKGLELLDIKFECGLVDGRLALIHDVSTDNMRGVRDGKPAGPGEMLQAIGAE